MSAARDRFTLAAAAPAVLLALLLSAGPLTAAGVARPAPAGALRLTGTLPAGLERATALGAMAPDEVLRFSITLPPRDPAGLEAFVKQAYTPGDPLYHHFLKTGEFADRFGPTQSDYDEVLAFARASGLTIESTSSNRMLVGLSAPVAIAERALGVSMGRYRAPDGSVFHAPDAEPALPAAIAARGTGVVGLEDATRPLPQVVGRHGAVSVESDASPQFGIGTGPLAGLAPSDIATAYDLGGIAENGAGQSIALVQFDGFTLSDIRAYETQFTLRNVPLRTILIDGATGVPTAPTTTVPVPSGPLEVSLDIELSLGVAQGLDSILVYEGGGAMVDVFNKIATDNLARQVSCSWGSTGLDNSIAPATRNSENATFQQMAAQGQSFYAATGDNGDKSIVGKDASGNPVLALGVIDPAAEPYVTAVGGTSLSTFTAGGAYLSESAWGGSNGGVSTVWSIPFYQSAAVTPGSTGSATARNLPDVSLNSDPNVGYAIYTFGRWFGSIGGTSCAAPMWAAYTARVNQRRATNGAGPLGFLNPAIYFVGHTGNFHTDLHDITLGNNGTYAAVLGNDDVTGWGSFKGSALFNDLQFNATAFWVDAGSGSIFEFGTPANPYKTVSAAVLAAPASGQTLIYIRGGSYLDDFTTNKQVTLVSNGGGTALLGH